jgi:4-diphosphocytidyl-2-C-methyl-D-erythritol kinase
MVMTAVRIDAPAKLNLHLGVGNRRPDGFHDLESIFTSLDFGDSLLFEPLTENYAMEIEISGPQAAFLKGLPPEKNLVFRAVSLFRERSGFARGLKITIDKHIPPGGGLGGGSSDAVSSLLALNALAEAEGSAVLSEESLAEMAALLGSDLPFFLCPGGAAWVSGRGERIVPLASPEKRCFVRVNPGFESETAAAFRLLDEFRAKNGERMVVSLSESAAIRALSDHPGNWPFFNDFLPVFEQTSSARTYREILAGLKEQGADFMGLSGAGSTCFGVFSDVKKAEKTAYFLKKNGKWAKKVFSLARRAIAVLE